MPLTVAAIEAELLIMVGPYLRRVGLDGTTADGTNVALRGPIRRAVLAMGRTMVDPISVTAVDIANLAGFELEKLLDVAELKVLEMCWGNWPEVDQSAEGTSQSLSQLADRLERRIKALMERIARPYGPDAEAALIPGPSAHGLIRAGRSDLRAWDWSALRACR